MPHALITGASSGIGAALALELARRGWDVSLIARRREKLEAVAASVVEAGARAALAVADVTDRQGVREAIASCTAELGPVDLAIANAGGGGLTPADAFDAGEASRIMRLNFDGVAHTLECVLPEMIARGHGHVAAMASIAGLAGLPPSSVYSASKAAVQVMMQSMSAELRHRGVAVTVINPGFVRTPLTDTNDFDMPFMWEVDRAARHIVRGLERRRRVIEFPAPLSWPLRATRWLPAWMVEWLIRTVIMTRT